MSARATFWAWHQHIKPATSKLVLLCLSDCHNGDSGQCNPSVNYIARMTGLDRKTVMCALENLVELGAVSVTRAHGSGNQYSLQTSTNIGTSPEIGTGTEIGTAPVPKTVPPPVPKTALEPKREPTKNLKEKIPPSLEDVAEYCSERKNGICPETFFDHYAANGWVRGKTKIKSWKACVRTWERSRKQGGDLSSESYL